MRVFRLLREYGARNIARSLIKDRAGSALFTLLLMGILVLEFGSLEILHIEQHAPGANITTGSDALWYVIVTISIHRAARDAYRRVSDFPCRSVQ